MCIGVYMCMHVYMCLSMCTSVHMSLCVYVYTCIISVCTCICAHVYTCVCFIYWGLNVLATSMVNIRAGIHSYTCIYAYVHVYVYNCSCIVRAHTQYSGGTTQMLNISCVWFWWCRCGHCGPYHTPNTIFGIKIIFQRRVMKKCAGRAFILLTRITRHLISYPQTFFFPYRVYSSLLTSNISFDQHRWPYE